jgi:hypothetical protein
MDKQMQGNSFYISAWPKIPVILHNEFVILLCIFHSWVIKYEGESNENRKTEIKIRNIAPLSYKLADMLPML